MNGRSVQQNVPACEWPHPLSNIILTAAVAFDVGAFVIIGMGIFSLSLPAEHLLFALKALPAEGHSIC